MPAVKSAAGYFAQPGMDLLDLLIGSEGTLAIVTELVVTLIPAPETILGVIGFVRIAAWSLFSNIYGPHWLLVASTVGIALVGIVLWGSLMGSMLPLVLKRLGFDPATSSAPFVATLVDVTGLIIYFSVAFVILRGTML